MATHVEMGNGVGTRWPTVWRCISGIADEVSVSRIDSYDALGRSLQVTPIRWTEDPGRAGEEPRWVPAISAPTAPRSGAHVAPTHRGARRRFGCHCAKLGIRIPATELHQLTQT